MTTYVYKADVYCDEHVIEALATGPGEDFDGWDLGAGVRMSAEDNLDELAAAFGVDRADEHSFDSDYFPKVDPEGSECSECEPIYNIYTLWEGAVETEEGSSSWQGAWDLFNAQVLAAQANFEEGSGDMVSVHLYEPWNGVIHAEQVIN